MKVRTGKSGHVDHWTDSCFVGSLEEIDQENTFFSSGDLASEKYSFLASENLNPMFARLASAVLVHHGFPGLFEYRGAFAYSASLPWADLDPTEDEPEGGFRALAEAGRREDPTLATSALSEAVSGATQTELIDWRAVNRRQAREAVRITHDEEGNPLVRIPPLKTNNVYLPEVLEEDPLVEW